MNRKLIVLFLIWCTMIAGSVVWVASASAQYTATYTGWWWQDAGNGYYLRVNDHGGNDGWLYTRSWYCGRWSYSTVRRVDSYGGYGYGTYNSNSNYNSDIKINYSKTWKEDLVKALGDAKKKELELSEVPMFIQAVKESGLQVNPVSLPGYGGYGAYSGAVQQGLSILTQGVQGTTAYGVAAYSPQPGVVDIEALQRNALRFQERAIGAAEMSQTHTMDALTKANDNQVDLAKFSQAVQGVLAAAQATVTPKTETHQWQSAPSGAANGSVSALSQVKSEVANNIMGQSCLQCHSGDKAKGDLDFTKWSEWSADRKAEVRAAVADRINRNDDKQMPPPGKARPLSVDEKNSLLGAMSN